MPNAGVGAVVRGDMLSVMPENFDRVLNINLRGTVFLTNAVTKGTMYATPAENIHVFGIDFGALGSAGLTYEVSAGGLIGVSHAPVYDHVSVETNVLTGMMKKIWDYAKSK